MPRGGRMEHTSQPSSTLNTWSRQAQGMSRPNPGPRRAPTTKRTTIRDLVRPYAQICYQAASSVDGSEHGAQPHAHTPSEALDARRLVAMTPFAHALLRVACACVASALLQQRTPCATTSCQAPRPDKHTDTPIAFNAAYSNRCASRPRLRHDISDSSPPPRCCRFRLSVWKPP
jgi:hypothetical protein